MLSAHSSRHLYRDVFEYWKLFFEKKHLILDVKTTFRLQKTHCENVWWKHIKNESCKYYLGNKEQKGMFLVVSWSQRKEWTVMSSGYIKKSLVSWWRQLHMSSLIFRFWTATVFTFLLKMASSCSRKKISKWHLNIEELWHKAGLRAAKRIMILEITSPFR